jgi:hypothetical protein
MQENLPAGAYQFSTLRWGREVLGSAKHGTLNSSLVPVIHSRPLVQPGGPLPWANSFRRWAPSPRSVGLPAFAKGKSFSPLPKWLKSQVAQICFVETFLTRASS